MDYGKNLSFTQQLFPTIDHSYLRNDGYNPEETFLDLDYQEADYGNDLDLSSPNCEKSGQHDEFVEYDDFGVDSLPETIRHPSVVVWIRYCSQLVVRISRKANATGRAFVIRDHMKQSYPCLDKRCRYSQLLGDGHTIQGGLGIITNKHVVKNDIEAKESFVEFFYHNSDRRGDVIREHGHHVHVTNHNLDYTMFTCNMHHNNLTDRIQLCTEIAAYAWLCIPKIVRLEMKKFAIVISHPHGTSKRISIGKVISSKLRSDSKESITNQLLLRDLYEACEKNRSLRRFAWYFGYLQDISMTVRVTLYDAATCPGSSGAPVYMGNATVEDNREINPAHTHRGKDPMSGYNNCYI